MTAIGWLIVFVILIGIEVMTMALTTIWFAGGALAAFFMALAGQPVNAQLVGVSGGFLCAFDLYAALRRKVHKQGNR